MGEFTVPSSTTYICVTNISICSNKNQKGRTFTSVYSGDSLFLKNSELIIISVQLLSVLKLM